jgi:hypothetical protein
LSNRVSRSLTDQRRASHALTRARIAAHPSPTSILKFNRTSVRGCEAVCTLSQRKASEPLMRLPVQRNHYAPTQREGEYRTFDARGHLIGSYASQRDAMEAVVAVTSHTITSTRRATPRRRAR